jgi:polygalacturonase
MALTAVLFPAVAFADPVLPTIPSGTFTVPAATGVASTDTANLVATFNAAVTSNGGGTVIVPAGTYLCNNFTIPSSINLQLSSGANIYNASPLNTLINISSGHDIEITGSGTIDGRATTTKGSGKFITISNVTNLLVSGVTICNASSFHLVPSNITNLTIDGININDNYTKSMNGGAYLGNTDGIDYSGSHILIKNCNISDGDDDIVAKPSGSHFCSDILITGCTIGAGHGISVGGQTDAGLNGLTVKNCTFNGTTNGLRMKAGPAKLDGNTFGGLGGVVKNVLFTDITMTGVANPIIINSWYIDGDSYGIAQNSASHFHTITNPGETLHNVDQSNNSTAKTPFYDNIRYTNITATAASGNNVAIIYGLDSQSVNPSDPLRNIDNISFNNVNLTGTYNADIYYASRLDTSGLKVNGSPLGINQTGNSALLPSYTGYTIWQGGNTTSPGTNHSPTDWNNAYNWTSDVTPSGAAKKISLGNQDPSNSVLDMVSSPKTVGCIYYSPDTSTTIQSSGGYSLTLNNSGIASVIDVQGSHTISAPVLLSNDVNITDTGTLALSGGISGSHAMNVQGGNLTAASINVNTLTISSGLTVTIQPIPGGPQALNDNLQSVPEPSILALLGINFVGLLAYYLRRRASR